MVKMRGVDLAQFRFDYDLKWAALFLNADGTVYARYGSGSADGDMALQSVAGLRGTMERVLEAHGAYPANRDRFAAKRGPTPPYPRAESIPSPKIQRLLAGDARRSCLHCHNVYDGLHDVLDDREDFEPRDHVFKYPMPDRIGLSVDAEDGSRITAVLDGSPAAKGGVRAGDRLMAVDGQSILSLADVQFALHFLGEEATARLTLERAAGKKDEERETIEAVVRLEPGWRESDISWRGSMWNLPPGPGFWTEELSDARKRALGIEPDRTGLLVRGVWHDDVKKAGIRKDDVIVAIDGQTEARTAAQFAAHIRLHCYRPGSKLPLAILRSGSRSEVTVVYGR